MESGRKDGYAPEIRDISHTARIQASLILADVFYRYTAARYWLSATAISGASCSFKQPETSIGGHSFLFQPTKTQASRVGLRSRPSIAKRCRKSEGDGRSSLLESDSSLAFSKALEAHMIPSQLNWRKHQTSSRQLPSPARFLCSFLLSVRRRRTKDVRFLESPSATRASRRE